MKMKSGGGGFGLQVAYVLQARGWGLGIEAEGPRASKTP